MRFAAYVPAAVRVHVSKLLPVLTSIRDSAPGQVSPIVREYFQEQNRTGVYYERKFESFVDEHLAAIIEQHAHPRELKLHEECLIRVAQDERMREAYGLLTTQFGDDESWHNLVWAATTASLDFQKYRIGLSNASRLCKEIGEVSDYLAYILRLVHDSNVQVPALYSFSVLVNKEGPSYNNLVPELPWLRVEDVVESLGATARMTADEIDSRKHDPNFGWRFARFGHNSPQNAIVMSALKTRQSNVKTDYLRAFGYGLMLKDPDVLTSAVQKAMADIATVAINDADIIVTYDDVRAVFTKNRQRIKENSSMDARASFPASRKTACSSGK